MAATAALSASEFASLKVIGASFDHSSVSKSDALRLLELNLVYRLLGSLRVTRAGRIRIAGGG
jgi:hypothetical protein